MKFGLRTSLKNLELRNSEFGWDASCDSAGETPATVWLIEEREGTVSPSSGLAASECSYDFSKYILTCLHRCQALEVSRFP